MPVPLSPRERLRYRGRSLGHLLTMGHCAELREFERSLPRVTWMIILMKTGGNAFADHLNRFNAIMNRGKELARWFAGEFGETQCRALTGCDFSSVAGAKKYIETGRAAFCLDLSGRVAEKVRGLAVTGN